MEKLKIDVYIANLLYSYDCVIVPDFGGFVANYAPAQIHAIQHKFTPPSKKISFNKNLTNNDGLLGNHIAERRSISYHEANELVKAFVNRSLEGLKQGDKIHIEKVGTLYLDPEQNIQFKAEESNDFLLDSFGLKSFRSSPIKREGAEERIRERIKEQAPIIKTQEKEKRRVYWPAAALLLVLFLSGFILNWQFGWVNTESTNLTYLGHQTEEKPFYKTEPVELETERLNFTEPAERSWPEGYTAYDFPSGESTAMVVEKEFEAKTKRIDNTYTKESATSSRLRFHVMGGCFSQLSNAQGLVNTLLNQGYQARLLGEYKNLHAVSYASFAHRADAIRLLEKVRNHHNEDAWLLVREF